MSEFKDELTAKAAKNLERAKARTTEALDSGKARAEDALKTARTQRVDTGVNVTRLKALRTVV